MSDATCEGPGCNDDCTSWCAKGRCQVGRKHFRTGGVCCISCFGSCFACDGAFYVESLTFVGERSDPEDGEMVDARLCHCCLLTDAA